MLSVLLIHRAVGKSMTEPAQVEEEIWIRPLEDVGKVVTHYAFSLSEVASAASTRHYQLFPKIIGQLIEKYNIEEMKFTITGGNWNHRRWGQPFHQGPFGAEISATFGPSLTSSPIDVTSREWKGYKSEMAALFSVSFGLLDETRSMTEPQNNKTSIVGVLPREDICTENLTPWLKLLPCRTHAGLGQLIAPIAASTGDYYALSILAKRVPVTNDTRGQNEDTSNVLTLTQTLTTVLPIIDTVNIHQTRKPWILRDVLGLGMEQVSSFTKCPFAQRSRMYVEDFRLSVTPDAWITLDREWYAPIDHLATPRMVGVFNLEDNHSRLELLNTPLMVPGLPSNPPSPPHYVLQRYVTGVGQALGGIAIHISNHDPRESTTVVYQEHIPWFLRIYFHTLRVSLNGARPARPASSGFSRFEFEPAENHGRPNELLFELELGPRSTLVLSFEFEKAFLQFQEYPPDSNRGMDLSSAKAEFYPPHHQHQTSQNARLPDFAWSRLVLSQESQVRPYVMYSHALLVPLPVPDFSMPYNVITLSSTVIAFFFGSMISTLLRRKRGSKVHQAIAKKKKAMDKAQAALKKTE